MCDLEVLNKRGITTERLKQIFTAVKGSDFDIAEKIKNRLRDRVQAGIGYNVKNYRHWYACDLAWDVPFRQTTYSLVRGMVDRQMKEADIITALQGVDISDMLVLYDKSGKQLTGKFAKGDVAEIKVHAPTFFNIFWPLAKSYTTIRAAAIVNSYRQVPLFEYEAIKSTAQNRLKSEIITDRVDLMSTQYGYFDVLKQAVLHMLHYSQAVLFPVEEWHTEPQILRVKDPKNPKAAAVEKEVMVKEGVRFNIPHPSRVFLDTAHRPSTLNSDTGCRFGGYWSIVRAGDILSNKRYWNNDKISTGVTDWISQSPAFFNTVYSSCALRFNTTTDTDQNDRETRTSFYTMNFPDRALTLAHYFEKVNPKEEGIGDYDYDVWFRYDVAGTDTVVYGAPLPYCPMPYFGYDALETRAVNASMTLEVLPFQDMINNLFSQHILTMKENLTNLTFFDTNQVTKEVIEQVRGLGQQAFSQRNFFPMDMRTNRIGGQNNVSEAFQSFTFPHQPTGELLEGVNQILTALDRMLVLSPQELAQTASHELTAEEVRNMNQGKSTRYEFTAGAVDRGVYSLKRLLYEGLMAYAKPDLYARLAQPVDAKQLDELGFTVEHEDAKTALVTGDKSALLIETFASNRDGDLRVNNPALATSMVQLLQVIASTDGVLQEVGPQQIISLINEIAAIGGLPRDFRLIATGNTAQQQADSLKQQVEQLSMKIEQSAVADVAKNLKPVFETQAEKFQAIEQQLQQLASLITQASPYGNTPQPTPPGPIEGPPPMAVPPPGANPPPGVEFAASAGPV